MRTTWQDQDSPRGGLTPGVPSVVRTLLVLNVVLFVVQYVLLDQWFPRTFEFVTDAFALQPEQWRGLFPFLPVWQLVSYGFLHGGAWHLLNNMLGLYFLGSLLEQEIGSARLLAFYLIAVALAGLCQLVVGFSLGLMGPILGASGGVLAIACAMATLRPGMRVVLFIVPMTLRTLVLIFVALDVYGAVSQFKGVSGGTANFAHLAGALLGFLAIRRGWIYGDPLAAVRRWRERRSEVQGASEEARLDELLAKISREGIHALSPRERAFLKRVSERR